MFSTEEQFILHDAPRRRAPARLAASSAGRKTSSSTTCVCIDNRGGAFNCGRCRKCVRTAIPLHALGLWGGVRNYRDIGTAHWEASVRGDHLALVEDNLDFARESGAERWLVDMLERVVRDRRVEDARAALREAEAGAAAAS